ncbi:MAG: glucosamine-6-phosphate deaminase [Oscillospiraceae bacterium]
MKVIKCANYDEVSRAAADIMAAQIIMKPNCVLGLATGSTPIGMYADLAARNLDFSNVTTFNLDEYYPLDKANSQSYHYFMTENLYSKVNLIPEKTHIPDGSSKNADVECQNYDASIDAHGGIDLQILGIGQNGHIGFNEPADVLDAYTHVTGLTQNTIDANSRFFESRDEVPTQAITMGVGTIMKAKKILLMACGAEKADVVKAVLGKVIDPNIPATILAAHADVTIIADSAALGE